MFVTVIPTTARRCGMSQEVESAYPETPLEEWPDWNEMVDNGDLLEDWLLGGSEELGWRDESGDVGE